MTGTFEVNENNTKIVFEYEALTATILNIVEDASQHLFDKGYGNHGTEENPILFNELSNQEKLDIVDTHLKRVVINLANTYKSVKAQDNTRALEESNKYSL